MEKHFGTLLSNAIFLVIAAFISCSVLADTDVQQKDFSRVAQNMAERQASVYQLFLDNDGLLWLATDTDGILRYDGQQFSRWTDTVLPSVSAPDFSKILIDGDKIWAATWGHGLAVWNSRTQQAFQFKRSSAPGSLKGDRVQTLFKDSQARLWVGSLNGLQYIDTTTSLNASLRFAQLGDEHPLSHLRIWWVAESDQALWFATSQGVFKVSPDLSTWSQYFVDPDNIGQNRLNEVRTIELISGTLWAGTTQGLFYLDPDADALKPLSFSRDDAPASLRVNDLVLEASNPTSSTLWVGASEGLYRVNTANKSFIRQDDDWAQLNNIDIRSLSFDHTGTLWVGTRGQGLFQGISTYDNFFDPIAKSNTSMPPGAGEKPIQAVHYASNGDLWLANRSGIYKRSGDRQHWQFFAFANEHAVREVNVLFTDSYGSLWVGTNRDVFKTRSDNPQLTPYTHIKQQLELDENTITAIHELDDGTILIGLWGQGIVRYQPDADRFSWQDQTFGALRGDQAYSIVAVEGAGIYSATRYSGLLDLTRHTLVDGAFNDATLLCADSFKPQVIWLCSDSGLWRYNTQTGNSQQFTEADGLPSNRILGLTADTIGHLWTITSRGLARLNFESNKIITLSEAEGLTTNSFLEHAIDSSPLGEITVGSMDGARSFNPSQVDIREVSPNIALNTIEIDNQNVTQQFALTSNRLILPEDYQTLALTFSVTDFRAPDKNAIRYQLSGITDQWSNWSNNLSLNFSALSPGTYQLRIQGRNSQGLESAAPLKLSLVVKAPWWYSYWALLASVVAFIAIIYAVIRLRTKTLQRANRKLESEIALRTHELRLANEKLHRLSETDPLTGLLNRRGFEKSFADLLAHNRKNQKPLSILLIDVDHFKRFNDEYGHDVGDRALKLVSRTLTECLREQDVIARWGGEEFAVALPGLDANQAAEAAERLRKAIAANSLSDNGCLLTLTATIGVSSFTDPEDNLETWIKAADQALYEGKAQGRNTVIISH